MNASMLRDLHDRCAVHLDEIRKIFLPHCHVTLVMRNPKVSDGDLFIGNDTPEEVIASIKKTCKLGDSE